MRRAGMVVAALVVMVALIAGCGGGSSVTTKNKVGTATGSVNLAGADPTDLKLALDGLTLGVAIQSDGSFRIPNIPPGTHVLDVLGPDGMLGGRAEFDLSSGEIELIPPIELKLGGQIVGMVMKLENGVLTPLANVQVVARSDLMWILADKGGTTVGAVGSSQGTALIYPPPEGQEYTAYTDQDGSYQMKSVKAGSYLVTVAVPGLEAGEQFVWVQPGCTAVADFHLEPSIPEGIATIQGTVTGADENGTQVPLAGALVEVTMDRPWQPEPPDDPIILPDAITLPGVKGAQTGTDPSVIYPPDIWWQVFATLTDTNGHYTLNVPSGRGTVSVSKWGYMGESRSVTLQPSQTYTFDFALSPWGEVVPVPVGTRGR